MSAMIGLGEGLSAMLGMGPAEISAEFKDALAKIANMLAGRD